MANYISPFDSQEELRKESHRFAEELLSLAKKELEKKPAEWTDEEKDKLNRIYWLIGNAADTHAFSTTTRLIGDKEAIELQDFLRSIAKPDFKPAEWSEEEKLKLRLCIDALNVGQTKRHIYEQGITPDELKAWLKSLRPQPHWKPSEEQMEALEYALGKGGKYGRDALRELYDKLKLM